MPTQRERFTNTAPTIVFGGGGAVMIIPLVTSLPPVIDYLVTLLYASALVGACTARRSLQFALEQLSLLVMIFWTIASAFVLTQDYHRPGTWVCLVAGTGLSWIYFQSIIRGRKLS